MSGLDATMATVRSSSLENPFFCEMSLTASVAVVSMTVAPSGADCSTRFAPMLPAPPPRFSITIRLPMRSARYGVTRRAKASVEPPGA